MGKSCPPSQWPLPLVFPTSLLLDFPQKVQAAFPTPETRVSQPLIPRSSAYIPAVAKLFSQLSVKIKFNHIVKKTPKEKLISLSGKGNLDDGSQGLHKSIRDPSSSFSMLRNTCFIVLVPDSCWGSSHHIHVSGNRMEEGTSLFFFF